MYLIVTAFIGFDPLVMVFSKVFDPVFDIFPRFAQISIRICQGAPTAGRSQNFFPLLQGILWFFF